MEERKVLKESLTPQEADEHRRMIKEYYRTPPIIGYIFLKINPLHPDLLIWLLVEERFDDAGIALVFLGGMPEDLVRSFLKERANWDEGRIDRAIIRTKNYYFYYSRDEQ